MTPEEQKAYDTQQYVENPRYKRPPEQTAYFPIWQKLNSWLSEDETIFEIGCGSGQLANYLLKEGKKYEVGIDCVTEAILLAQEMNPDYKGIFIVKNILEIQSITGYNTVIATEVLEHVEEDLYVISLLPKNTRFIFSVPNFMTKGHKRCFANIDAVLERYRNMLKFNQYFTYTNKNKQIVFLIDSFIK